ncbi:hypothetical protein [Hyphomonas sp.]|uniref:hypothetical protein n=1 Tax=Hyphomonas sp. TaxID=87 RepID=UPI000C930D41|nr:hypothetical protein [Hyphomonas sp.]MAL44276.1 hypothetical protein [Hyphomonas sp.]|tara:strand:- start:401 stop:586 length:186 start_codon:yes stop_codon:yes gene_type:complete
MYDIDTISAINDLIKKEIEVAKENIIYSIDTQEGLQYARGKINALETLLQELKNLRNREDL